MLKTLCFVLSTVILLCAAKANGMRFYAHSVGEFANPDFIWTENVPNFTLNFNACDTLHVVSNVSTTTTIQVDVKGHRATTLTLNESTCTSTLFRYTSPRYERVSASCNYARICGQGQFGLEFNLTIFRPHRALNFGSVTFTLPNGRYISSRTFQITKCPTTFEESRKLRARNPTSRQYGDVARVYCSGGVLFITDPSGDIPPRISSNQLSTKTCGPYGSWQGSEHLYCWADQTANITALSYRSYFEIANKPTIFLCHNPDRELYTRVALHVPGHEAVENPTLAWTNVTLKWSKSVLVARCIQHHINGQPVEHKLHFYVSPSTPQFVHKTMVFMLNVGHGVSLKIPIAAYPVVSRTGVRIGKEGKEINFELERLSLKQIRNVSYARQYIIISFNEVSMDDLGNYTVTITTRHGTAEGRVILLKQTNYLSTGVIAAIVVASTVTVVFLLVVSCVAVRKIRNGKACSPSDSMEMFANNIGESVDHDDVFLPRANPEIVEPKSTDDIPGCSTDPTPSCASSADGVIPVDEDGYLRPLDIAKKPQYVTLDANSYADAGSINTEASYVNTLDEGDDQNPYANVGGNLRLDVA